MTTKELATDGQVGKIADLVNKLGMTAPEVCEKYGFQFSSLSKSQAYRIIEKLQSQMRLPNWSKTGNQDKII